MFGVELDYHMSAWKKTLIAGLISYIDAGDEDDVSDAPYFGYLAFQAVHIPVQAPREFSNHYKGQFDQGWDAIRRARWERAQTCAENEFDGLFKNVPAGPSMAAMAPTDDAKPAKKRRRRRRRVPGSGGGSDAPTE